VERNQNVCSGSAVSLPLQAKCSISKHEELERDIPEQPQLISSSFFIFHLMTTPWG